MKKHSVTEATLYLLSVIVWGLLLIGWILWLATEPFNVLYWSVTAGASITVLGMLAAWGGVIALAKLAFTQARKKSYQRSSLTYAFLSFEAMIVSVLFTVGPVNTAINTHNIYNAPEWIEPLGFLVIILMTIVAVAVWIKLITLTDSVWESLWASKTLQKRFRQWKRQIQQPKKK